MGVLSRLAVSGVAGIGVAVAAALVVALIDLYIAGHGYASMRRPPVMYA